MKIGEMQFVVKEDYNAIKDKVEPNHKAEYVKTVKEEFMETTINTVEDIEQAKIFGFTEAVDFINKHNDFIMQSIVKENEHK